MLEVRFLGKFDIRIDGFRIEIPARKAQSLFAYLILNAGVQHRREKVAGVFWPDSDENSARSKLRYALWQLRKSVGDSYFLSDKISVALNDEAEYWFDCAELESKTGDQFSTSELQKIVELYEGELLPGFYEDWIFLLREQFSAAFEEKITLLLERLCFEQRWRETLSTAEKWISLAQIPEPAYQVLMLAHSQLGDNASAINVYQRCEQTLEAQLGVEPSDLSKKLYRLILGGEIPQVSLLYPAASIAEREPIPRSQRKEIEILPSLEQRVFVAREEEINWLIEKIDSSLSGSGQVALVVGNAGQGKTALIQEFSRRAQRSNQDLLAAYSTCEAYSGIGDPHLPFRNILALLTGDLAAKQSLGLISSENARRLQEMIPVSVETLIEFGPDLIESFVPGAALLSRLVPYRHENSPWIERLKNQVEIRRKRPEPVNIDHGNSRKDLFNQYTGYLQRLAGEKPLLLILDDLQWADLGTINLLFHLARRIEGHRILILGAYRRDDVVQYADGQQHPLIPILTELKRSFGEIEADLDRVSEREGRQFIEDILNTEPNGFNENFRRLFFLQTAGHPLFTIELLRQMQEQGDIFKDDQGRWIPKKKLGWEKLPAKVEAVIAGRVNRLHPKLREIINVASVEGEEFTAEVVAKVIGADEAEVIHKLSQDLDKRYLLVEASGIMRLGEQRLSGYRFRHNLFLKYVYEDLDAVERSFLHEKVAHALEQLYHGHTEQIAVQLARHYEAAGVLKKTIDYLLLAGKQAKQLSANEQAVAYLKKGIDLLGTLPDGNQRDEMELLLQIALGAPLVATEGYASPEVERTYERARLLCKRTGDLSQLAPTLWGLCAFYQVRGKHSIAYQLADEILDNARNQEDAHLMFVAHWMQGISLTHIGNFPLAKQHLEYTLEQENIHQDESLTYLYGQNPRVTCLAYLALNLWILGYSHKALEMSRDALNKAEELNHPFTLTFVHGITALLDVIRRDINSAVQHSDTTIRLAKKSNFPFLLTLGMIIRGWSRGQSGKIGMAEKLIKGGIEGMEAIGAELGRSFFLSQLAESYSLSQDIEKGLKVLDSAMEKAISNEEHWYDSGLYWLLGRILEMNGAAKAEIADKYWQAIEIARTQEARSLELRGVISLLKLDMGGDKYQKGKARLKEIHHLFAEDLDNELLLEARSFIE